MKQTLFFAGSLLFLFFLTVFLPSNALASHSWGGYHWARTAIPFTIKLGNNLTSPWTPILLTTSSDWTLSSVLDTTVVAGSTTSKRCRATAGRVEVCNSTYGNNGWLGIAQVWISGDHITQGIVKMNDTYFKTSTYNTTAWKNLVLCQEVGHTFGLDHQDENFDNAPLGTCMDYTNNPTPNQHPNAHDYQMLESIYAHIDSFTTISQYSLGKPAEDLEHRSDWGTIVRSTAQSKVYKRDLGGENQVFTFVFEADPSPSHH